MKVNLLRTNIRLLSQMLALEDLIPHRQEDLHQVQQQVTDL